MAQYQPLAIKHDINQQLSCWFILVLVQNCPVNRKFSFHKSHRWRIWIWNCKTSVKEGVYCLRVDFIWFQLCYNRSDTKYFKDLLQKKFKTFPSFSTVIGLFISTSQTNFSIHQFIKIAFIDINESFFDALTFMATILISFSMSCILILLNIPLRSSLPKLQTFYAKSLSQILSKKPAISCKFKWKFIVLVFAHAINSQLMLLGLWLYTTEKTNSTYSTHIARMICDTKIKRLLTLTKNIWNM